MNAVKFRPAWLTNLRPAFSCGPRRLARRLAAVSGPLSPLRAAVRPWLREDPLPSRPLVAVAMAVAAGAACPLLLAGAVPAGFSLAVPTWAAAAVAWVAWAWLTHRARPRAAAAALLGAVTAAAAAWSAAHGDLFSRTDLAWCLGELPAPVVFRGRLVEPPLALPAPSADPRPAAAIGRSSECTVEVEAIRDGAGWRPASGRARLVVGEEPAAIVVGSRVSVFGRGLRPAPAANPGEPDFAARARAERRLSLVRVDSWACVRLEAPPAWWSLAAAIDRLRARGAAALAAHVADRNRPLAAALLLGDRDSLAGDADAFQATGTIHVLSISGLHVGLLAAGLFALLRCLCVPQRWACLAVAAVAGVYMLVVGAGTPVVRATLLVWIAAAALALRRRPSTINSLAAAAIVVLAWRPAEVLSPGAQLSFLSTAVLVGMSRALARRGPIDPVDRLIERSRSRWERIVRGGGRWLAVSFLTGGAIWLATAPLVAHRFHVVSPVGLVANLLIAPLVPVAMGCGLSCILLASVWPAAASLCGAGCDAALTGVTTLVAWSARLPAGHAWVAGPPGWWVAGWYALLGCVSLGVRPDLLRRPAAWAVPAAAWCGVGLIAAATTAVNGRGPGGLEVTVAAMGHGCGIVVRSPAGRCLVYDAGRLGGPAAARRSLAAVLWSRGIRRIDTLVLSHADADHFNAVPELLPRFAVGEVVVSEAFAAGGGVGVTDLLARLAARRIPVRSVATGDSFALDPLCRVRVLHPAPTTSAAVPRTDNESSLVLAIEAAGRRVLFTGDLEGPTLEAFAAAGPGECDVLVAPHHGSLSSLPPEIARVSRPKWVLVSGRGGRGWPAVRGAYAAAAGCPPGAVLKTGGEGAIAVTLTAGAVRTARFKAGRWQPLAGTNGLQEEVAARGLEDSTPPATSRSNWLATYAPRSSRTPLVKP